MVDTSHEPEEEEEEEEEEEGGVSVGSLTSSGRTLRNETRRPRCRGGGVQGRRRFLLARWPTVWRRRLLDFVGRFVTDPRPAIFFCCCRCRCCCCCCCRRSLPLVVCFFLDQSRELGDNEIIR